MQNLRRFLSRARAGIGRYRQEIVPGRELAESIDIGRLICPLRYDLCVRIEFIRLLRDEWSLYTDDRDAFLDRPESKAYFIWFSEVACARFRPWLYEAKALIGPAFLQRVHATAKLWKSIEQHGYEPATPIRLASGRMIQPVNGKVINSTYFAGDGCHRISCLYLTGQTRLEPEQYEVDFRPEFTPLDNTAVLLERLSLDRAAYLRFLSRFYCDGRALGSADEILQHVATERTELLPELLSVFAFDLPRVRPG